MIYIYAYVFVYIISVFTYILVPGHIELKSTPRGPGYLCWKKGCNQYFKTEVCLQTHFREIHAKLCESRTAPQPMQVIVVRITSLWVGWNGVEGRVYSTEHEHVLPPRVRWKCQQLAVPEVHGFVKKTNFVWMTVWLIFATDYDFVQLTKIMQGSANRNWSFSSRRRSD